MVLLVVVVTGRRQQLEVVRMCHPTHRLQLCCVCLGDAESKQQRAPHPHIVHANLACVLNFLPRPRAVIIVTPVGGGW